MPSMRRVAKLWREFMDPVLKWLPEPDRTRALHDLHSTAQIVLIHYTIARARPELHDQQQKRALEAIADLSANLLPLLPPEEHAEFIAHFTQVVELLDAEFHNDAPDSSVP